MKIIKLNETQFTKIFEGNESTPPSLDGGDIKEFPGSEISTSTNITNMDGDLKYGKEPTTDVIAKQLAVQNFWASSFRTPKYIK